MKLEEAKQATYTHIIDIAKVHSVRDAIAELKKLNDILPGSSLETTLPFNSVYIVITEQLQKGISTGVFKAPELMEQLDLEFVRFYFHSLNRYVKEGKLSATWEPILTKNLPSFVYALLGANIHITHDLALAIDKVKATKELKQDFLKADKLISKARKEILAAYYITTSGDKWLWLLRVLYERPLIWLIIRWRHNSLKNGLQVSAGTLAAAELKKATQKISKVIIGIGRGLAMFGFTKVFQIRQ